VVIAYQVFELEKFHREVWAMKPNQLAPTKHIANTGFQSLGKLGKEHLMGNPLEQLAKPVTQGPVVDTTLKLELVGTIRGVAGDESDSALIRSPGKETKRYHLGNTVEGGAVLHAVDSDFVLIKRGDKLETLRYSNEGFSAVISPVKRSPKATQKSPAPVLDKAVDGAVEAESKQQAPLSWKERLKRNASGAQPQDDSKK
jgi:hypothetical protein